MVGGCLEEYHQNNMVIYGDHDGFLWEYGGHSQFFDHSCLGTRAPRPARVIRWRYRGAKGDV